MIMSLNNNAEPNYKKIREVFQNALSDIGKAEKGKFDFTADSVDNISSPEISPKKKKIQATKQKVLNASKNIEKSPKKSPVKTVSKIVKSSDKNGLKVAKKLMENSKTASPSSKLHMKSIKTLKKMNMLEYSMCEDDDVEIIIKKRNTKTGKVIS